MQKINVIKLGAAGQTQQTTSIQKDNNKNATVPIGTKQNNKPTSILIVPAFSDNITSSVIDIKESLGLKHYNLSFCKDSNSMLKKSQTNLIDLIKYYDGDPDYGYEGYTAVYSDTFGKKTTGFGHYYPPKNIKTQEQAYTVLAEDLKEANKVLKNKIGKEKYNNLPLSIREALIDLAFNKGPDKITKNTALMNAINNNDYSKIVANIFYYTSGSTNADKTREEAGLYRRSLSRAILATRDLSGKELQEAKKEIDNLYKNARNFYINKAPDKNVEDLDNVYKCLKNEPITTKPRMADNYKVVVQKGSTIYSTANEAYKAQNSTAVTMQEYREAFYKINKNPKNIKAGEELIAPAIKNVKAILGDIQNTPILEAEKSKTDSIEIDSIKNEPKDSVDLKNTEEKDSTRTDLETESEDTPKEDSKSYNFPWGSVFSGMAGAYIGLMTGSIKKIKNPKLTGIALLGAGIGIGLYKLGKWLFGKKKTEKCEEPTTEFQRLLKDKNTSFKENGDFVIINGVHKIKKGDTLYGLAIRYGISQKTLCSDNNIKNPDIIKADENLKLQNILGYKVQQGDNIHKIAEKFGLSEEILIDLNEIDEGKDIGNAEIIRIPGFPYTVKSGDTLFSISKRVGVSIDDLKRINHLETDTIHPNQNIIVIYNNSDYDIPEDKIKETSDKNNNTITVADVSDIYKIGNRKELKTKTRVNGKVVATRAVFEPSAEAKRNGKLAGKTIIVNAGHGYSEAGVDIGTAGSNGLPDEWLLNYDNAMKLKNKLIAQGAKVIYLQGKKSLVKEEIYKPENKADMFISVHANSADPQAPDRTQIVYREAEVSGLPKQNSIKFAKIAEKKLDNWISQNEKISNSDKFIFKEKQDYAQISTNDSRTNVLNPPLNYQHIPGIIWEVGFMTNRKGQERLKNGSLMNNYCDVMTKSIIEYFQG